MLKQPLLDLLERAKGEVRDINAEFYSAGVPEVPFPIKNAARLPDGRFLVAGMPYFAHRFGFVGGVYITHVVTMGRIVPALTANDRNWPSIVLSPQSHPYPWKQPRDEQGRMLYGIEHWCCDVVVDSDGILEYPGYALSFPLRLSWGELTFHERLPITSTSEQDASTGWAYSKVNGHRFDSISSKAMTMKMLAKSPAVGTLVDVVEEHL